MDEKTGEKEKQVKNSQIFKLFSGQEKLWKAFWIYLMIIGFFINLTTMYIIPFFVSYDFITAAPTGYIMLFLPYLYFIAISFAIWRCAYNVKMKIWGHLARIVIAIYVILLSTQTYLKFIFLG